MALGFKFDNRDMFCHDGIVLYKHLPDVIAVRNTQFDPVNNWQQCGKIMEDFKISSISRKESPTLGGASYWQCDTNHDYFTDNSDLKTAICRCFVKSKFGDEVEL